MKTRKIGALSCHAIGLGCMNLSHGYGEPVTFEQADTLLNHALDQGYNSLDTAALYGCGANEALIGKVLASRRNDFVLASKCGMFSNEQGIREINGRPDAIRKVCEQSLQRLQTDVIDLYYLHRLDPKVAIEESVGALSDLVREGKIREVGLSEISADTLRRAMAEHPIAAVQSEYSLWTRNPEIALSKACAELGTTLVAFSPVARGFLGVLDNRSLSSNDFRYNMPRFSERHYPKNLALLEAAKPLAERADCSLTQLGLAWLLAQGEHILPIPGTQKIAHLDENLASANLVIEPKILGQLSALINHQTVSGLRYPPAAQKDVDTELFESEIGGNG
jgi:aryl-alcohol dehydrogenase-like predicted oxidoreductase